MKRKKEYMIKEENGGLGWNVYPVSKKEFFNIINGDLSEITFAYITDYIDNGNMDDCYETYFVNENIRVIPKRLPYGSLEKLEPAY